VRMASWQWQRPNSLSRCLPGVSTASPLHAAAQGWLLILLFLFLPAASATRLPPTEHGPGTGGPHAGSGAMASSVCFSCLPACRLKFPGSYYSTLRVQTSTLLEELEISGSTISVSYGQYLART